MNGYYTDSLIGCALSEKLYFWGGFMTVSKKNISRFFILILVAAISCAVNADLYLKIKNQTDGFQIMGRTIPGNEKNMEIWFSPAFAHVNNGTDTAILIDLTKNLFYLVQNKAKSYSAIDMNKLTEQMNNPQMAAMMQNMQLKATVNPTGETKKIKEWNCSKWIIEMQMPMGLVHSEAWVTKDLKVNLPAYLQAKNAMLATFPGFKSMLEELKKVAGVQVQSTSTTTMMGSTINSTEELLDIAEKPAPAGMFEIPKGFKKTEIK
jgi:hypothetical protein